jgi:2'-5' RNA ligase
MFLALWPDMAAAARLHLMASHWKIRSGGRVMREDSLHSTLVFIGDVALSQRASLLDLAGEIRAEAFRVAFDISGCWRHNQIAYLGMKQIPAALLDLQTDLVTRVRKAGFRVDAQPYCPHITLIRKAECSGSSGGASKVAAFDERAKDVAENENPAEPVVWTVRDFVLVKSSLSASGSHYEQVGRWPLLKDNPSA